MSKPIEPYPEREPVVRVPRNSGRPLCKIGDSRILADNGVSCRPAAGIGVSRNTAESGDSLRAVAVSARDAPGSLTSVPVPDRLPSCLYTQHIQRSTLSGCWQVGHMHAQVGRRRHPTISGKGRWNEKRRRRCGGGGGGGEGGGQRVEYNQVIVTQPIIESI